MERSKGMKDGEAFCRRAEQEVDAGASGSSPLLSPVMSASPLGFAISAHFDPRSMPQGKPDAPRVRTSSCFGVRCEMR
jgi:hypothetical protein